MLNGAERHGKYLMLQVGEAGWLVLHFGMTGFVEYFREADDRRVRQFPHLLLDFRDGYHLAYANPRKLGMISWTRRVDAFLMRHRTEGAECPWCGGTIGKIRVPGRPAYFCGDHQSPGD